VFGLSFVSWSCPASPAFQLPPDVKSGVGELAVVRRFFHRLLPELVFPSFDPASG